jgi:hypothetical protein
MKEATYSKNGEEPSMKAMRRRNIGQKKCDEGQIEENKRIQKDKILDEEEDEEKEEEDEYAKYSKKKR